MKIKVKDSVLVTTGKDRGKIGTVSKVLSKHNKIIVEGLNIKTKHIKKTQGKAGEKIEVEGAIHASNVMIICPESKKPSRVSYKLLSNGKKERTATVSGVSLETKPTKSTTRSKKSK